MTELNIRNFMDEVELSDKLCVIDLYADWCGPCSMLAPIMAQIEIDYKGKPVKFFKINVDKSPDLAEMFGVSSIPLLAFVKDNTFVDLIEGLAPREAIVEKIEENLAQA